MAKAWKDVIASEQYQALAPDQKAQAQEQYFNEVVAPQAGDQAEQARQAFYAAYPAPLVSNQQLSQPASQEAVQPQQQGGIMSDLGYGLAETGRGLLQAGINVANIPAELTDAVTSAAAWAGNKLGIGDGTYQPAPRVTTQGLEQDFGLQPGTLTPQTTEGRIFAEALPYLTPAGLERGGVQAAALAERIAPNVLGSGAKVASSIPSSIAGRVAEGGSRLLAENAVGSLAANSDKNDASALA
ncbi:lytic transglycosylase domain-containing protein, partial [Cronobacter sakazakii]|nr:lytic transglycosylase domain-containing protein [Cronobacter sakazakii]